MRIPIDAPERYRVSTEQKTQAESLRSGPIEGATGLRPTLSEHFTEAHTRDENEAQTTQAPHQRAPFYGEERRNRERRQEKRPVLLDTRLKQRRQDAAPHRIVNFDI